MPVRPDMHILIALTYYRPHYSGLTIYAEREARALASRGLKVTILTSRYDQNLPAYESLDGIEIHRLDVRLRISKGVIMPGMPAAAWHHVKQADIIHLHVPQFDAAAIAMISRLLGKPVVLTYHCDLRLPSGVVHYLANQVSNLANHLTAQLSKVIVHNTMDYAEHSPFLRRYLSKVHPIFPPVVLEHPTQADIDAFRQKFSIQPGQRIIGMAARLAAEKGVEYLAQALPSVIAEFPRARLLFVGPHSDVVGEDAYASQLKPLIDRLGEHWSFLGILSPEEMASFFHVCEVTVLPSVNSTESYGMVQVESIACGTPVVASDIPGVRVPVRMTGSGCIVPPGDAATLAEALQAILHNPQAFRGNRDELVQLSTPEAVAEQYEAIFKQVRFGATT